MVFQQKNILQNALYAEKVKKDQGAINHGMVVRPGHYRIFKNLEQKIEQMSIYHDPDENIPNKLLEQYKKEVIDPILELPQKGISPIEKEEFLDKNKTVRNLNKISYRLLNFILYNQLFFANCLGYISNEELKNILVEGMNCLEIIQSNWNLLEEALKEKNISSIQAFLNLIFNDITQLISNCELILDNNTLKIFEGKIEKIIEKSIQKYPEYESKYLILNKENTKLNEKNIRVIISEALPPLEDIYQESEYPLLKYFQYTEYQTKNDFINALGPGNNYKIKYPLLYNYLQNSEKAKKLKYLHSFNEYTNYMVDTYSYQISREKAKQIELKNTKNFDKIKFNNFKKSWDNIYQYAKKYKCRDEMPLKKLSSDDKLIYFLNDDNEIGYGMYLAAACQNFILWQNEFLQPIIDSAVFNGNLHYYVENMKKKVPVQEANYNQILSIDDCFINSDYKNFDDLVYTFTRRDVFDENGKINYKNYNLFSYNFSLIEEELGKLILPEKCLFDNEDKLNFVIFWGEGFRGGQSEILQKFYDKYPQVDLNENETQKIFSYIKNLYKDKNYDFKSFFGSMQLIIFYLGNNSFIPDKDLKSILSKAPDYLKLNDNCIEFFKYYNFKINQFMSIFFYIEHLSFQELIKTLNLEYKKDIDEIILKDIKNKSSIKKENDILPWNQLAAAVRRFISRYLTGERQTTDINENNLLEFYLRKIDLWEEKYGKLTNLENLISDKINKYKLKVCQAYKFYEIIGDEDKNSIIFYEKEEDKREQNKEEIKNEDKLDDDIDDNFDI